MLVLYADYVVQAHRIRASASAYLWLCQDLLTYLDQDQGFSGHSICPDFISVDSRETRCTLQYCVNMQPNSKAGTYFPPICNLCFLFCLTTVTFHL